MPLLPMILAASLLGTEPIAPSLAVAQEDHIIRMAQAVLDETMADPRESIPRKLLQEAEGIVIVPNLIKAGFIVGGRFGRGVMMAKNEQGVWSNPVFITVGGGSFGFQAGAKSSEMILVFRTRRSIDRFLQGKGQINLGGDVSAAAGPVGRDLSAATNLGLNAEIYTYGRSKGLFAGLALQGSVVKVDWNSNSAFYQGDFVPPAEILRGQTMSVPVAAAELRTRVQQIASPAVPSQPAVGDGPTVIIESDPGA